MHTTVTRGEHLVRVSESPDFPVELLGGWTTEIGSVCNEASKCIKLCTQVFTDSVQSIQCDPLWSL